MAKAEPAKGLRGAQTVTVGLCGGDGIRTDHYEAGKTAAGDFAYRTRNRHKDISYFEIEGLTLENRMALGEAVPTDVLEAIKACDVILRDRQQPRRAAMERQCHAQKSWTYMPMSDRFPFPAGDRLDVLPGKTLRRIRPGRPRGVKFGHACHGFKVTTEPGTRRIARLAAFEYASKANGKDNGDRDQSQ